MKISKEGLDLIKKWESYRNHPYLCPAKIPTIGYGNTFYEDGTRVTMIDPPVTRERAERLLLNVVQQFENGVNDLVKVGLTQNQFDALVSFSFNVGLTALRNSTLLKLVNINPNDPGISAQFARWNKAGGQVLKGLSRRRADESWLYTKHLRNEKTKDGEETSK